MITKDELLASMRHESEVIKHLATKVPADAYDYRPTPGQRSLLELMAYMTRMSIVPTLYAIDGNWDRAEAAEQAVPEFDPEIFAAEMDHQMAMIDDELSRVDEATASSHPAAMPWGTPTTLSAGLMDMTLKTLVAYRMQFFLYIKAAGNADIGPANCWVGVDWDPAQ